MSAPDLTKAKHTPGPWIVDSRQEDLIYIGTASEPESFLAEVWSPENKELNEVDWANARLIAAAPDLLKELKDCLSCLQMECDECEGCTVDPCVQCRSKALIRKAEGF